LNADLDLGFVTRFVWTGRNDSGAVVRRHVGIGTIHRRFVEAGLGNPGTQVVADYLTWHPADERQHVDVRRNPVRQRLCPGGFCEGVAGGTEYRDKDLGAAYLAGRPVDHLHGVTGEIDEDPLTRRVNLAQRRLQPSDPFAIKVAKPGITESILSACPAAVFFPKQ
jgi:hypothetical protein